MLDLVKQKGFYPYEYISEFEKFKEELPRKEKFYSLLIGKKTGFEQIWNENEERLSWFLFKMWRFTVSTCFWKI